MATDIWLGRLKFCGAVSTVVDSCVDLFSIILRVMISAVRIFIPIGTYGDERDISQRTHSDSLGLPHLSVLRPQIWVIGLM